jgi:hypothetical protein
MTLLLAACVAASSGGTAVPPVAPSRTPVTMPPPSAGPSDPALPPPAIVTPVSGQRERRATWTVVTALGRSLVLEVKAGGAPCDAITGVDVDESSAGSVTVTVWSGRTPGATCDGVPAMLGTFRVAVNLSSPLGARTLLG